jgi:hypothetical protein
MPTMGEPGNGWAKGQKERIIARQMLTRDSRGHMNRPTVNELAEELCRLDTGGDLQAFRAWSPRNPNWYHEAVKLIADRLGVKLEDGEEG